MKPVIRLLLVGSLVVLVCGTALAQRGGGRAGGARHAGGGPGGGARPSFNRTPSLSAPSARPQMPAARPQMPAARPGPGAVARPQMPAARPGIADRPGIGQRPSPLPGPGGNRPGIADRPGTGQRPGGPVPGTGLRPPIGGNVGNTVVNRPNVGNNINVGVNRPGVGANRPGGNINSGNTIVNNTTNNINNINVNRPAWASGNPAWAYRPGWGYHQGWVNGYWHGQNNANWWNNWGGFATGLAVGGIGAWGIGSAVYNWGYRPYVNPYVVASPVVIQQPAPTVVVQQPATLAAPVDYSQPLSTSAPPPDPAVADPAIQTFDEGRAAFKDGNYALALQKTDEALKQMPTDAAMHEFRALCLFALKQYDQAASTLYAVLSAGPGWDWTTLIGLYPNVDIYTSQLRSLEDYRTAHPESAPARFVLAYHYLTQGHTENAVEELKEVVKLQPADQLSAQLIAQLSGQPAPPAGAAPPAPTAATAASAVPVEKLVGRWSASPAAGTTITLTLGGDGRFRWEVTTQGKTQPIEGSYVFEAGILTLTQSESNAMVGKVTLVDDSHFLFQAMGGGPGDPGLSFSR